ncbi:MAG: ATP-binding protein [Marinoscillum sp.]
MRFTKLTILIALGLGFIKSAAHDLDSIASISDSLIEVRIELLDEYIAYHQNDTPSIMNARMYLAQAYMDIGFSDRALAELDQIYGYYKTRSDSVGITESLNKFSEAYSSIQEFKSALEYALLARRSTNDSGLLKGTYHRLGYLHFNLEQYDSARYYFNTSIKAHLEANEQPIKSMLMLTALSLKENDYDKALSEFLSMENQGLDQASAKLQYVTYKFISALYQRKGNVKASKQYSVKLAKLEHFRPILERDLDFLETVVEADKLAGNYEVAFKSQMKYVDQIRKYYRNNLTNQLASYQKLFQLKEKESAIELLEKENQLYELKQRENKSFVVILFLGIIVLLLMLMLGYRMLVIRTRTNKELKLLNKQISSQRKDLSDKNQLLEQTIKELKGTQSQLIQAEKMASIGSFVSGVAHELNNPINILNGGLQVIERNLKEMEPDQDKKHRDLIDDINIMLRESSFSITKINRIIQALVIATYTDQTPVEVDFTEIIDNVKLAFRPSAFPDIKFVQEVESVKLTCFPNRIHHAIKAILENAFYYAGLATNEEKIVKISVHQEGEELLVNIENNGPSIPKTDLLKIFDPFYTTKDDGESPGLGLYFAFSAVTEHNGLIIAKNAGEWVVMSLKFPLYNK